MKGEGVNGVWERNFLLRLLFRVSMHDYDWLLGLDTWILGKNGRGDVPTTLLARRAAFWLMLCTLAGKNIR